MAMAADEGSQLNGADMAYMAISTLLVLIMTPALAFFYGGLVRRKNTINTIMMSMVCLAIFTVQWFVYGYSLSFGPDVGGIIGNLDWAFFHDVGMAANPDYSETIPHILFALFQMAFAILTPAIVSGGIVERTRFPAYCIFILLWGTLVYDPMCHMVWGVGGFIRNMGALDFAGGTVIHVTSGFSALTAAILIGRRKGYGILSLRPHNIPYVCLGGSFLWLGWFGFNSGAGLSANDVMTQALANTGIASCTAGLVWIVIEEIIHKKMTALGLITPAAGFVDAGAAFFIGITTPLICYFFVSFVKSRLGYDDSLDAFGCHGMGGVWGALMTGIFCTKTINDAGADGLLYGNPGQLIPQMTGIVTGIIVAVVMTTLIIKVLGIFMKVRATASEEAQGLDLIDHGERAYNKL
jgi:ammonium transporter, Amt family